MMNQEKTSNWIPEEEHEARSAELTGGKSKFEFAGSVAMSKYKELKLLQVVRFCGINWPDAKKKVMQTLL